MSMTAVPQDGSHSRGLSQRLTNVIELLAKVAQLRENDKKRNAQRHGTRTTIVERDSRVANEASRSKVLHDFRIACRRGETALSAYEFHFENSDATWIRQKLHKMRDSCNALRDDEVLLKWLKKQPESQTQQQLSRSISRRIRDGYPLVSERAQRLILQHRLRCRIQKLSASVTHSRPSQQTLMRSPQDSTRQDRDPNAPLEQMDCGVIPLSKWLFGLLDRLIQNFPEGQHDFEVLHDLRIATKRLRYGMEYICDLCPQLNLSMTTELLQEMQEKLGELHDAVVRKQRLKQEFKHSSRGDQLRDAAREELRSCVTDWQAWWQPKVFRKILQPTVAEIAKLLT